MKGSGVLLLGCFALYTTQSDAYSVKFISEDDQVANPRGAESGSSSTEVATHGDTVQSVDSDTVNDENGTVTEGDNTKPVNQSVPEYVSTKKSKIRKRDTLGLVRDLMVDMQETKSEAIDQHETLEWLKVIGNRLFKCFKNVLRFIEEHEMEPFPDESTGKARGFTKVGMIKWLQLIQSSMSQCIHQVPLSSENIIDPVELIRSVMPPDTEHGLITETELMMWIQAMSSSLDRCFQEVIRFLEENEVIWEDLTNANKPSPEVVNQFFGKLAEIVSNASVLTPDIGDQTQDDPPNHTVPPPKKANYFGKQRKVEYPVISNLPGGIISGNPPPVAVSISGPIPGVIPQENPSFIPIILPNSRSRLIIALPSDIYDTRKSSPYFSLLDLVLDQINAKLQGKLSSVGMNEVPSKQGLRDDVKGVLSLFSSSNYRPNNVLGHADLIGEQNIKNCIDAYVRSASKSRAA